LSPTNGNNSRPAPPRRQDENIPSSAFQEIFKIPAESIFCTLFPADCKLCGTFLTEISHLPVCRECIALQHTFQGTQCHICGELLTAQIQNADAVSLCFVCREERPHFERATSFGPYEDKLLGLVHLLKYDRMLSAVEPLSERLAYAMRELAPSLGNKVIVVPVPLHASKSKHRGFNQADTLARAALKNLGHNAPGWMFSNNTLQRVRDTVSQTGLSRHQRQENIRGAFEVKNDASVRGKRVLLVDDVMTTGVTADECARVLRRAGAEKVYVATVARVTRLHWGGRIERRSIQ